MLRYRLVSLVFVAVLIVGMAAGQAFAQVQFDGDSYDATHHWYVYNYSLVNPATDTDSFWVFSLTGLSGVLGGVSVPPNWDVPWPGIAPDSAAWTAELDGNWDYVNNGPEYEVKPGATLPGFSIYSTTGPGKVSFYVGGIDDWVNQTGPEHFGTTEGPAGAATPELSSSVLLLLGMLPVGLAWRRRRGC